MNPFSSIVRNTHGRLILEEKAGEINSVQVKKKVMALLSQKDLCVSVEP